jgi:hypothetical protein
MTLPPRATGGTSWLTSSTAKAINRGAAAGTSLKRAVE